MNEETSVDQESTSGAGRIWRLRTLAAVAVTAVALSGAGGAALAAASEGGSAGGPGGRGGFGPAGEMHGLPPAGGRPPRTNGVPGQLPPATTNGGRET